MTRRSRKIILMKTCERSEVAGRRGLVQPGSAWFSLAPTDPAGSGGGISRASASNSSTPPKQGGGRQGGGGGGGAAIQIHSSAAFHIYSRRIRSDSSQPGPCICSFGLSFHRCHWLVNKASEKSSDCSSEEVQRRRSSARKRRAEVHCGIRRGQPKTPSGASLRSEGMETPAWVSGRG